MLDGWLSDDQLDADFTVIEPFQGARDALNGREVAAYASAAEMATARTSQDLAFHMVVLAVVQRVMLEFRRAPAHRHTVQYMVKGVHKVLVVQVVVVSHLASKVAHY